MLENYPQIDYLKLHFWTQVLKDKRTACEPASQAPCDSREAGSCGSYRAKSKQIVSSFLDSGSSPPLASPLITQVWNHREVMPYTTSAVYVEDNSPLWANSSYLHGLQVSAKKITEQTGDLRCGLRYNLVVLQAHLLTSQIYFLPPRNLTPHEQITTAKKWRR